MSNLFCGVSGLAVVVELADVDEGSRTRSALIDSAIYEIPLPVTGLVSR
jgi:hypothetical protein